MKLQRILHIDDDSLILGLAKVCLEKIDGVNVRSFDAVEDALPAALEDLPDLVLLDLNLAHGKMDGIDALREISRAPALAHISVILMTGEQDAQSLPQSGNIIGVIHKPFAPKKLAADVVALWDAHKGK